VAAAQSAQRKKALGPERRLFVEWEGRFDQQRIGQQRQQAAGVTAGVKEIRVARGIVIECGEPDLQQRRSGGNGEHCRTGGAGELDQQPPGGPFG
jgi:hypothetical protein